MINKEFIAMDDWQKNYEEFIKKLNELSCILDEKLGCNEITQWEYDEIKSLNVEYDKERDPIELFKELFSKKQPIKCSKLLFDIYCKHERGFRKAILLSECFSDPLGYKYDQPTHEFIILIIEKAFELAKNNNYSEDFILELRQLYLAYSFFNHNNLSNTEKLNKCDFMQFSLSEQIRMICIFIQDQNRISNDLKEKHIEEQEFITGMEASVSDRKPESNPNTLVSFDDNFEGLIEAFDVLIPYLYFKKKKDYTNNIIPNHGDITHLEIPSFELVTHLSIQRSLLIKTWEKFKYSQWNVRLKKEKEQEIYVFTPMFENEYKEHIIANYRRQYSLMINLFKNSPSTFYDNETTTKIIDSIDKNNLETLFSINKADYFCVAKSYKSIINSYKANMHPYYLELIIDGLNIEDIFKVFEILFVLADCYKQAIYKDFDKENKSFYKFLCPVIPIEFLTQGLKSYYDFESDYSLKLVKCFIFEPGMRGENDIFSRPLLSINLQQVVFCPTLIEQMNIERIIETLVSNFKINISKIGYDFENRIKGILNFFSAIKVNTSKIAFVASDGRDVEFDFIGTFDDYLLLWEFKAMTVPYGDKKHLDCKKTIQEAVQQIERRSLILNTDWKKIKELTNIDLPQKPFCDEKIIKLVVTNIFDFTTLLYGKEIRVVDESTILKFFVNPDVKVMCVNDKNILGSNKLWKNQEPTASELLHYLNNPITTSPYNQCMETFPKLFECFEDDYPFAIFDQILTKDPYEQEIKKIISNNKSRFGNKKPKRKNSRKNKRKRRK